uniref:Uncharacterized protein n=1 Tax=Cacopsylla melanoneura TaxID=428564 RepID=A0A8D8QF28_9HEMI
MFLDLSIDICDSFIQFSFRVRCETSLTCQWDGRRSVETGLSVVEGNRHCRTCWRHEEARGCTRCRHQDETWCGRARSCGHFEFPENVGLELCSCRNRYFPRNLTWTSSLFRMSIIY